MSKPWPAWYEKKPGRIWWTPGFLEAPVASSWISESQSADLYIKTPSYQPAQKHAENWRYKTPQNQAAISQFNRNALNLSIQSLFSPIGLTILAIHPEKLPIEPGLHVKTNRTFAACCFHLTAESPQMLCKALAEWNLSCRGWLPSGKQTVCYWKKIKKWP
jgi:hypothetical protein